MTACFCSRAFACDVSIVPFSSCLRRRDRAVGLSCSQDLAGCDIGKSTYRRVRANMSLPYTRRARSEEHTSELQSLMRISYAVFCLKKKTYKTRIKITK